MSFPAVSRRLLCQQLQGQPAIVTHSPERRKQQPMGHRVAASSCWQPSLSRLAFQSNWSDQRITEARRGLQVAHAGHVCGTLPKLCRASSGRIVCLDHISRPPTHAPYVMSVSRTLLQCSLAMSAQLSQAAARLPRARPRCAVLQARRMSLQAGGLACPPPRRPLAAAPLPRRLPGVRCLASKSSGDKSWSEIASEAGQLAT